MLLQTQTHIHTLSLFLRLLFKLAKEGEIGEERGVGGRGKESVR